MKKRKMEHHTEEPSPLEITVKALATAMVREAVEATQFSHLNIVAVRAELGEKTLPEQFNALGSVLGHRIFYTVETEAAEPFITCWIVRPTQHLSSHVASPTTIAFPPTDPPTPTFQNHMNAPPLPPIASKTNAPQHRDDIVHYSTQRRSKPPAASTVAARSLHNIVTTSSTIVPGGGVSRPQPPPSPPAASTVAARSIHRRRPQPPPSPPVASTIYIYIRERRSFK
ncbi:unnamed protein product [Phyllotreta striolata]|uniref:Uncharacterized protein n=1 Tax=Phyllotreta striolata TaxID=444603 RepID=A0A9N9TI54_PHYSR|nr:unnamed protein product [Phyllotreta striolata]